MPKKITEQEAVEIVTRPWTTHHQLVENPQVIQVKTIKKKYIEQLTALEYDALWMQGRFSILGRVEETWVLLMENGSGVLYKVHNLKYREYLMHLYRTQWEDKHDKRLGADPADKPVHDELTKRMQATVTNMPQLFAD